LGVADSACAALATIRAAAAAAPNQEVFIPIISKRLG
jgi:hypothetical protein